MQRRIYGVGRRLVLVAGLALAVTLPGAAGASAAGLYELISLTPSSTEPYFACPHAKCSAVVLPAPLERGGRFFSADRTDLFGGTGKLGGFAPKDLQSAYGIPSTGGSEQTIAVVEAGGDAAAAADLAKYRAQYKLPACTAAGGCFREVTESGEPGNYPALSKGWEEEISLDLDMASAGCPECKLLLVESKSESDADLAAAVHTAAALGATEISNSYGESEDGSECAATRCAQFAEAYDVPGVVVTASAGDSGYDNRLEGYAAPQEPASFPSVISVGGTVLHPAAGARKWTESAWPDSGGGCSLLEPRPVWQPVTGCESRADNDIAADASTTTPVSVYTSAVAGGWLNVGGTSVGAPLIAAIAAHATVYTRAHLLQAIYEEPSEFNDVTTGSNGPCKTKLCNAGPGWDGPTGVGTPAGVPNLAPAPALPSGHGEGNAPAATGETSLTSQ